MLVYIPRKWGEKYILGRIFTNMEIIIISEKWDYKFFILSFLFHIFSYYLIFFTNSMYNFTIKKIFTNNTTFSIVWKKMDKMEKEDKKQCSGVHWESRLTCLTALPLDWVITATNKEPCGSACTTGLPNGTPQAHLNYCLHNSHHKFTFLNLSHIQVINSSDSSEHKKGWTVNFYNREGRANFLSPSLWQLAYF